MHIFRAAVVAAVVAVGWCSAQSPGSRPHPRPQRFRPSTSTSSGDRHSSDDRGNTIFTTDLDQNTFPGSGASDGFLGSGRPGGVGRPHVFVQGLPPGSGGFRPSGQGFGTPSTSSFGSQGGVFIAPSDTFQGQGGFGTPTTFSQGVFTPATFSGGQGTFGTPNTLGQGVFGTPTSFGTPIPRQGNTIFNTGLTTGSGFRGDGTSGTGTTGRFPSSNQFGGFGSSPSGFGGGIPVFVGVGQGGVPVILTQSGVPIQGFFQPPLSFSQTPGGFSQSGVPFSGFGQGVSGFGQGASGFGQGASGFGQGASGFGQGVSGFGQGVGPLGFNQIPVTAIPGSPNVPTVFPPSPVGTSLGTNTGGIFGTSSGDRRRPGFDSSSSSSTAGTLTPRFPHPNPSRRVFLSGKSGTPASTTSTAATKTETN